MEEVHFRSRSQIAVQYCDGLHSFPLLSPSSSVHYPINYRYWPSAYICPNNRAKLLEMYISSIFCSIPLYTNFSLVQRLPSTRRLSVVLNLNYSSTFFVTRRVKLLIFLNAVHTMPPSFPLSFSSHLPRMLSRRRRVVEPRSMALSALRSK